MSLTRPHQQASGPFLSLAPSLLWPLHFSGHSTSLALLFSGPYSSLATPLLWPLLFSTTLLSIGSHAYTFVTVVTPQHHSVDACPKLRHQHHLKATAMVMSTTPHFCLIYDSSLQLWVI